MKHTLSSLPLTQSFDLLGEDFYSRVSPTPFTTNPVLVNYNQSAADLLDMNVTAPQDPALIQMLSGAQRINGSNPFAMLYAGHQFGHYVPQLGDGRAIVLGETTNQRRERWEIQLKGSGLTPYSRDGDGRAVLRSTIREYLCSEAMHALGIKTTRALCVVGSDDEVYRERIEPGAMLTRLSPSHVRFGSFEVFYYREQYGHVVKLADYVIDHHYPEFKNSTDRYTLWLEEVIDRTALLIAQWQSVGFCHGVMNTDNMSVLGLTIDYGPYGFMEAFDPGYICNHSDHQGRYAYNKQPDIGLFNLSCFAQAILPALANGTNQKGSAESLASTAGIAQAVDIAKEKLEKYGERYLAHYAALMRAKLGLEKSLSEDELLIKDLLALMAHDRIDFTILFRRMCDFTGKPENDGEIRDLFIQREAYDQWAARYRQRLDQEARDDMTRCQKMKRTNPKFILRNYMAENAIRKAEDDKDYSETDLLMTLLQSPYDEHPDHERYAGFPPDWASGLSVSCSS